MRRVPPVARLALAVLAAACSIERVPSGRPPGPPTPADSLARIEEDSLRRAQVLATLRAYYDRFSARDWRALRRSFWPGATLTTTWTPPGERRERVWVQSLGEFLRRTREGPDRLAVFSERMVHAHVTSYGDLAAAWVVYQARFGATRDSVTEHRGVDAFTLMRQGGSWRIVSLVFINEQPGRPLRPEADAARAPWRHVRR